MSAGVAANLSTNALQNGAGGYQIIAGKSYPMYSPEWYAAQRSNEADVAGAAGTAAGTYTKNAATASGLLSPSLTALDGSGGTGAAGTTGAAGAAGTGTGGTTTGAPGAVPKVQMPDPTEATNQAFARAKDTAGNLSRASLDALNGELGSQGMLGGGGQAQGAADILARATNTMGEESNMEAGKNVDLAADFAKTNFQGGITQRGQDIQQQEAQATLAQEKSFQQQQLLQSILAGLAGNKLATPAGSTAAGLY